MLEATEQMVHLNSILHPEIVKNDPIFAKTSSTASTASSTAATASSTDAFGAQLAAAIEGYLAQSGNGSQFEINVQEGQSKTTGGASQFTVTVTNLSNSSASATATAAATTATAAITAASSASAAGADEAVLASAAAASTAVKPAASPFGGAMPSVSDLANMTPDEAYWAEQPAAVQALKDMPADQVGPAAIALAQQGYVIDVPIMVWGWDPLTTMVERQNYGYTWVPSGLQAPVQVPPGLAFPGLPTYDPNKPPAGSIAVTTAFAAGTNMQNVFIDPAQIAASMTLSASS
jgi:hypothetical protein